MKRIGLIFFFLFCLFNCYGKRTEAEKAIYNTPRYAKTLKRALKHPLKAKYVYIENYTDSVFPNDQISKLLNIEQIVLYGKNILRKKKTDSLIAPSILKIDTIKLKQLSKLKYLTIAYINFKKFPIELCYLNNLKGLDLSICFIDSLPNEIENLKNLKVLMLRLNNVSHLPNSIRNLDSLIVIDLANNSFRAFPEILCEIKNLKKVNLNNVEGDKEQLVYHWKWPFPTYINKIDYLIQVEFLKRILMNSNFESIALQVDNENSKIEVRAKINSQDLFRKTKWRITPNY